MARIRTIKPEFPQSESMGRVSREHRLLFILLWTIADDEGRLRGNSRMLASLLFPYDNDAADLIDDWLKALQVEQCIACYEVDGKHYVQILNWLDHQKIDHPTKSKYPPAPNCSRSLASTSETFGEDQRIKDQGSKERTSTARDENPREQPETTREYSRKNASRETPATPAEKISLAASGGWDGITPDRRALWATAYPAVNLDAELAAAAAWAMENPKNRKSNWGRFIANWLKRSQDRAPAAGGGKHPPKAVTCDFRGNPYQPEREPCGMGNAKDGAFYGGRPLCEHHKNQLEDRNTPKTQMPDEVRAALADLVKKKVAA